MDGRRFGWLDSLLSGVLFWSMFAVGSAGLAAGLMVPAWHDYLETRAYHAAALHRNEELARARLARENQLAHHRSDEFYNARYAERELNIDTGLFAKSYVIADDAAEVVEPEVLAEPPAVASRTLDLPLDPLPQPEGMLAVFVLPQTRPAVLALSALLFVGALTMIPGRRGWAPTI